MTAISRQRFAPVPASSDNAHAASFGVVRYRRPALRATTAQSPRVGSSTPALTDRRLASRFFFNPLSVCLR